MSLSKKHFTAIAAILRDERETLNRYRETADQSDATRFRVNMRANAREIQIARLEDRLIDYFKSENPNFNPDRFREASHP